MFELPDRNGVLRPLTQETLDRFHGHYQQLSEDECWLWNGPKMKNDSRGCFSVNNKTFTAPRMALALKLGYALRSDQWALHSCDNPRCVNPDHLWVGDQKDNMADCAAKGRMHRQNTSICINGHTYTAETTMLKKSGVKVCRLCHARSMGKRAVKRGWNSRYLNALAQVVK